MSDRIEIPMGEDGEGLVVAIGGDGWARYFDGSKEPKGFLRVRFARELGNDPRPRLVVQEVWLASSQDGGRISARRLRDQPLGRIEAAVNATAFYDQVVEQVGGFPPATISVSYPDRGDWDSLPLRFYATALSLDLDVPEGWRKPDDFLGEVLHLFDQLRTYTQRPANEIAEANGVPVTTVHGWVKEARRRAANKEEGAR